MYQMDFTKPCHIHFIGIGGISMSGLAEVLLKEGFTVSGSDNQDSDIVKTLKAAGATVMIGQKAANITDDIDVVCYTAAIHKDNEEFKACENKKLPMLTRAELLGQMMKNYKEAICISGTHGKTTTTSMLSEILLAADTDPTISVGGILESIGGNIRVGGPDIFLTEACEYTNSFLSFFPTIAAILNIEEDHLDFFKDINDIRNSFRRFSEIPGEDGLLIISADIDNYEEIVKDAKCKVITFGNSEKADYQASKLEFDEKGMARFNVSRNGNIGERIELSVPGNHNVTNALASIAVADYIGIDTKTVKDALFKFHGANRRFQIKGEVNGITVIDDYAHHPTEIKATLNAARNFKNKKLTVVFQPHTYSRTKALFDDFVGALMLADRIILTEIYAAREKNTIGISSRDLEKALKEKGAEVTFFENFDDIEKFILANCQPGELLITMGAGNVDIIGDSLLKK